MLWFKNKKNSGEVFEEELFIKYGKCHQLRHYGLKILFISDTHNCLTYYEKNNNYFKNLKVTDYDICFSLFCSIIFIANLPLVVMHIVNMEQKRILEVPIFGSIDYIAA